MKQELLSELSDLLKLGKEHLNFLERLDNGRLEQLLERANIVAHKLKFIPQEDRPNVLILGDLNADRLLDDAYTKALLALSGGRFAELEKADKIIVRSPEGQPADRLFAGFPAFSELYFSNTGAYHRGELYLVDGRSYLNGDGEQLADDVELLAEIIYPKYFIYGGEGTRWNRFEME